MFVGENGIRRVIQRTCEIMREHKIDDPMEVRRHGVIDLPTIQRYLNFHFSVTVDLFGADVSSNAATFYTAGIKGRYQEGKLDDDHALLGDAYPVLELVDGKLTTRMAPAVNALNERLRDDFIKDTDLGMARWNKIVRAQGIDFAFRTPHKAFNRKIGTFAEITVDLEGRPLSREEWARREAQFLPSAEDRAYVQSLMGRVVEPGKFANWIAPPAKGIEGLPVDFEYVRFN
jgi:benzoyl-CoA 2,3-epoxidase subunit B